MSVPINSDGMTKFILEHINKGWSSAEQYISKFMLPVRKQVWEVILANPGVFRPPKPPNHQLYDPDSCPIISEFPDGYALLANTSQGGTLGIFGHPSGERFKNALDFLPHFKWLGGMDVTNTRCSCRLCMIIYQEDEFIRQTTTLAQSPPNHDFISPYGQLGLQIPAPSYFANNGAESINNGMQNNGPLSARSGNMNGNLLNDLSPEGINSGSPLELFPSHLANLSQIPLQQSFHNQMALPSAGTQLMQGGLNGGINSQQQSAESQKFLKQVQQSRQEQRELQNEQQIDRQRPEVAERQPKKLTGSVSPSNQSPIHVRSPASPSEYAPTPDHTTKPRPSKAPSNSSAASKPPRKPRAKKAKNASTPASSLPAKADTPRALESTIDIPPETPDIGHMPPNYSGDRSNTNRDTISPKSTTAPSPAPAHAVTEEAKMVHKVLQMEANNQALEKDIENLLLLIKRNEKKVERLKFERRLLLGTLNTQRGALSGSNTKRTRENRDDTSDSLGSDPDAESEVLHTDDLLHASNIQKITSVRATEIATKKKRPKKKRIKLLDPNAPKRPANAFIMFCDLQRTSMNAERRILQKLNPDSEELKSMAQLTKALGAKWRNLKEEERKEYQDMFHDQVQWYDAEIKEYMAAHPNAPTQGSTEPLPDDWTDFGAPKRPANPFFVFCEMEDDRLKKLEEESATNEMSAEEEKKELERVSLALITRWRLLDQETRKDYIQEYECRLEAYTSYTAKEKKGKIKDSSSNNNRQRSSSNNNTESAAGDDDEEDELEDEMEEPEHAGLDEGSPRLDLQQSPPDESGDDAMDVEQEDFE